MNVFLSIIIPAYNVAPYIGETLHSIELAAGCLSAHQTIEVIVVDDGSSDETGEVLDDWTAGHAKVNGPICFRIIHQNNVGVSAARNRGLEMATGRWVWFVDGDDLIHADALVVLESFNATWPDADYLMFNYAHDPKFLTSRQVFEPRAFQPLDAVSAAEVFREVCRVFFRRDLIGDLRFLSYKIGEDVAFSLSYRAVHRQGCIVDAILYYYRVRTGSATVGSILSAEKTADWIRANQIIFEKMAAIIGGGKLVWWYPSTLWQGFNGCPHALPFKAVRPFYRDYVNLLYAVDRYCPYSRNRSWAIRLLHRFPSPILGWLLIYGQERLIQACAKRRRRS